MAEYIDREALLKSLPVAWDSAVNAIKMQPAADVAPVVHGRWIPMGESVISKTVKCSACRYDFYFTKYGQLNIDKMSHCPNCGAKMDGEPCTPSK